MFMSLNEGSFVPFFSHLGFVVSFFPRSDGEILVSPSGVFTFFRLNVLSFPLDCQLLQTQYNNNVQRTRRKHEYY